METVELKIYKAFFNNGRVFVYGEHLILFLINTFLGAFIATQFYVSLRIKGAGPLSSVDYPSFVFSFLIS